MVGLPAGFGSSSAKPIRKRPPPSPREIFTGSNDEPMNPGQLDALREGTRALNQAVARETSRRYDELEARKKAEREAQAAHDDAVWQRYLEGGSAPVW